MAHFLFGEYALIEWTIKAKGLGAITWFRYKNQLRPLVEAYAPNFGFEDKVQDGKMLNTLSLLGP